MSVSAVGRRYAKALFSLAQQQKQVPAVGSALRDFAASWEDSAELRNVFENPSVRAETRAEILQEMAQAMGLPPLARNSLRLLADRGRLRFIGEIAEAYSEFEEASSGRVRAEVTTATALPEAYFTELEATLRQVTGRDVTLTRRTDPTLIGGVVTRIGDQVFDGSIKHRLSELKDELLR